ncbi:PREDICTED: aspartic and glutamic acid-rich protein-like [Nicrophorus vespilloides]|uniref:Aspartic and glutamic acid-rich protein-like n=1 Tax=Nicrophorus vespilloides TaxID=110193 RepID=A0ABM1NCP9_NICVS|nr:PREDICTED: aspartic and glutamic acid-rich protein-like [Nicrophorus vespilloides]
MLLPVSIFVFNLCCCLLVSGGPVGSGKTLQRPIAFSYIGEEPVDTKVQTKRNSEQKLEHPRKPKRSEPQSFLIHINDDALEENVENYEDKFSPVKTTRLLRTGGRGSKKFGDLNEERRKSHVNPKEEEDKQYLESERRESIVKHLKDYEIKQPKVEEKPLKEKSENKDKSLKDYYEKPAVYYVQQKPSDEVHFEKSIQQEITPEINVNYYKNLKNKKDSYGKPVQYDEGDSEVKLDYLHKDKTDSYGKPLRVNISEDKAINNDYEDFKKKLDSYEVQGGDDVTKDELEKGDDKPKFGENSYKEVENYKENKDPYRNSKDNQSNEEIEYKPENRIKSKDYYKEKNKDDLDKSNLKENKYPYSENNRPSKDTEDKFEKRVENDEDDSDTTTSEESEESVDAKVDSGIKDLDYRNNDKTTEDSEDDKSSSEEIEEIPVKKEYYVNDSYEKQAVNFDDDKSEESGESVDANIKEIKNSKPAYYKDDDEDKSEEIEKPRYYIKDIVVDKNPKGKEEIKDLKQNVKEEIKDSNENEGKDSSYYEEVVDADAKEQTVGELKAAASKGVQEKKNKDVKFEKGGGKEHDTKHAGFLKETGEKGYKVEGKNYKKDSGHHDKVGDEGSFKVGGKKNEKDEHNDGYYGEKHKGDKGKKGAKYDEDGKHNKGHSTKGTHNVHKKDEYEKMEEFYDEYHEEDGKEKAGGSFEDGDHKKGDKYKKSKFHGDHHHDDYGKMKHHHRGKSYSEDKGHKTGAGHDKHHDHVDEQKKMKFVEAKKKWSFKHGPDGTYKVVEEQDKKE